MKWKSLKKYEDILFEFFEGIAKITINRPEVMNAFRPQTVSEMSDAFKICRENQDISVVILTGAGDKAFCAGFDVNPANPFDFDFQRSYFISRLHTGP